MLNCEQFRSHIINPVLSKLQVYSKNAEELLVFTCAAESDGGTYLAQIEGPAVGIYQMEPRTYTDIWVNYIQYNLRLSTMLGIHFNCARIPEPERLMYDLNFATAMARLHYMRVKEALPDACDKNALWEYYKKYYNTEKGNATKEKAITAYERFTQA